jgi:hypothetical protein
MLFYRAALPLSSRTLTSVAGIIRRHRAAIGSGWRKLNPGQQALLVLVYLRKGETFAELAAGFGVGTATAWRYVNETVALLAARAPKLRRAVRDAKKAGHAYVVVDGTLIPVDRVAADRPFYSGKHRRHGMNLQVIASPAGDVLWVSGALPGSVHDKKAGVDLGRPGRAGGRRPKHGLDGAAGPAAVAGAHSRHRGDGSPGQLLELPVQRGHIGLDGHHVTGAPAEDDLCGVALRVHCVDRDNCGGEVGERFQQVAHRGDLVGLLAYGDLAQDRADAVRQGRDQVRGLPGLVLRAADGLAVDSDHQPTAGLHRPGVQLGTKDPVQHISADQRECAPEGGLLRRAAHRAQHG